jgi:hypothetical protein
MLSVRETAAPILFRPLEGVHYEFRPVALEKDTLSGNQSGTSLVELIVLSDSPNCPHPSFRHVDGHFHTGDFFEEVKPGQYASRGRTDDWIKSANGLRCDTKYELYRQQLFLGTMLTWPTELLRTISELFVDTSFPHV